MKNTEKKYRVYNQTTNFGYDTNNLKQAKKIARQHALNLFDNSATIVINTGVNEKFGINEIIYSV